MTDSAWLEIEQTTEAMIQNWAPLAQRNPEVSVKGDDFDALLRRAREAFPQSEAIAEIKEVNGVTTLIDVLGKLSIIGGAVKAAFAARNLAAAEAHNARLRGLSRHLLDR